MLLLFVIPSAGLHFFSGGGTSCMILFDKYPDLDVTATELSRQKYFSLCNVQELFGIEDTHRVSHLMK